MLIACLGIVLTHTTLMIRTKITKLHLSPISLHSASSVRIPSSVNNFRDMLPTISCGHQLGKGWPLGSRLWCLTVSLSLSHWYPGSGVVLDCIDSWSLHPYLLCIFLYNAMETSVVRQGMGIMHSDVMDTVFYSGDAWDSMP